MTGMFSPRNPIGGTQFAGRVVEVGAQVTEFAVGDDVFGGAMHGAYAEYISVSAQSAVAKIPPSLGYAEAVVLPYGAGTALTFLRDLARVQPNERVLIVGAAGGVGRMGIQIAKHLGAHVTAVCGEGAEIARSLGADEIIDYRKEDFSQRSMRWDVIFDTTPGDHFGPYRKVLSAKGRYLSLYFTPWLALQMVLSSLLGGQRPIVGVALPHAAMMREIAELAEETQLTDPILARFPLGEAALAHSLLETERPHGSIVIDVVATSEGRRARSEESASRRSASLVAAE
jgi:NADPH:quinone reductase-like Zn-dependent oxidoreductase